MLHVLLEPQSLFNHEKVSNHGSIPITIDCPIVFEEVRTNNQPIISGAESSSFRIYGRRAITLHPGDCEDSPCEGADTCKICRGLKFLC
ncbi:hypothetical protein TNCV_4971281 [Trichonephila clavipes]|nr:hypothetical protein TNCV_4971281 [Trichonephila clavipes]